MLNINDYNYPLPDERIAKYPLPERDHSKLLLYKDGNIKEHVFYQLPSLLPHDTRLVCNNTRVIQARLVFHKQSGARIEVFCLEPVVPHDYQLSLSSTKPVEWKCMIGNLKKWKEGTLVLPIDVKGMQVLLHAERLATNGNTHTVRFSWSDPLLSFAEVLDSAGELPIPPYLNRPTEESDKVTYQTVYSRIKGSVAAPTAGLHFTDAVLADLAQRGIERTELTLHVGAGTFQPVKTDDADKHVMHTEIIAVPRQAIEEILSSLGHICAVGTTSMRTLESLYYIGMHPENPAVGQTEPYDKEYVMPVAEALRNIIDYLDRTGQQVLHAETQIMIKPGYKFRIVDMLLTNFHQPKSTLLLLVSAFVGEDWKKIYTFALDNGFRFLSYGDSSLLFRHND
ncbi:MAG: S-adenosylmethionine:tRNA ribosyltransferase-isomerase [Paludibacteraceae bacterium]|nr:S-adenosylmethionine:tRNA ribosyltransferase-isomerase [Paludibacteraceae bacterium]